MTYARKKRKITLRDDFSLCVWGLLELVRLYFEGTDTAKAVPPRRYSRVLQTIRKRSDIFLPSLKAFLLYEPVRRFYASINVS